MTQTKVFREPSGKKFLGHPVGLYLLFMTELWERFSYYGMRAILVLYLTGSFISGGLGFEESYAYLLYGWFTGLVYFTPLIGGWIADKYLGHRKAITIGGLTMFIGQMVLFLFASKTGLYAGLLLLIIGNGFFKPNISVLVGGLYKQGDPKRDSAFSIFYMGINIGAFFAPLIVGLFVNNWFGTIDPETNMVVKYAYNYGFLAAALGMLIGQIFFNTLSNKYLGDLGVEPEGDRKEKELVNQFKQGVKEKVPLTKAEKQRTIAIFVYFFFAIFFFAGFEQAGSSFTLFTKNYIDRFIGGFEIPTEWFQSINPLFIVLLTPIFATFWPSKTGQKITTPIKMGTGIVLLGLGFLFMVLASSKVDTTTGATVVKISMWWMVITYLMHTIGELCLSPVGLSTVTKLSPPKLASLLMGVWLLSSFFGNIVAGQIASATSSLGLTHVYEVLAIGAIVFGIALICLNKVLLKMMNGVR